MTIRNMSLVCVLAIVAASSWGCQAKYRSHADQVATNFAAGNYCEAAAIARKGAEDKKDDETERVIYNLEAARASQVAGNPELSRAYYDAVYADTRPYLDSEAEDTVSEALVTTSVNQAMRTYKATPPERIMCHSLNAINCLAIGDRDAARVELRLAQDWQEDAKNRYASEIEAAQARAEEDGTKADIPSTMVEHFANLDDLRGYGDFQNPFASHLRGVYFAACGADVDDRDAARFEFREVIGTNPDCIIAIEEDLKVLENPLWTQPPTTWVYFMTGRAPHYEPMRIDVPIPVGSVPYVSAEFPTLQTHEDSIEEFSIASGDAAPIQAVQLCDMDSVVGSEFATRLPTIIAQEVASAAGKAAATYAAGELLGSIGQFGGMAFQAGSTAADLRSWRTMPKYIYVARIATPESGHVSLTAGDGQWTLGEAPVSPNQCNLIVVTMPSTEASGASIQAIPLTGTDKAVSMVPGLDQVAPAQANAQ